MDIFQDVTEAQARAIRHRSGPLLVIAGAGSGKTRVVTRRIAHLIHEGQNPWNILGITFTNKAADEMRERVKALIEEDPWISTFHSFCARTLRRHLEQEGYTKDFTIFDEDDKNRLLREVLEEVGADPQHVKPAAAGAYISRLKNAMKEPEEAPELAWGGGRARTLVRVYHAYLDRLQRNNALDFDDLLLVCIRQIETRPELHQILQDRFQTVLVDEFQDTNRAQYRLVNLLAQNHKNLCVTGDPDQSIYRWRGADIRNILDFEKDYPEAITVKLEQNWRSTKAILHLAGTLIANNRRRKQKAIWTENPQGHPPDLIEAADEEDEGVQVAERVDALLRTGYIPSDIALFYRTNAQSRALEAGLRWKGVPYVIVGSVEFYRRKEVKDVLAYLRLAANPRDDVSFLRAVNTPPRGIGAKSLDAVRAAAAEGGTSLFEAAEALCRASAPLRLAKRMGPFLALVEGVRETAAGSLREAVESAVERSGMGKTLETSGDPKDRDRLENLRELAAAAGAFEEKAGPRSDLRGFLEEVALISDVDGWDDQAEAVSLMTLHSSKGLEFPVVFITGLEENLLPHGRSMGSEEEIEEERRLCYVGITRAMDRLALSFARRRSVFGDANLQRPSRFLAEIGMETRPAPVVGSPGEWGDWKYEPDPELFGAGEALKVGDRVLHAKFGEGDVVSLTGFGAQVKIVVRFARFGK
ncbi:MAG: ATP-dependent helicase, partial [Planctomycetota bacterium]